MTNAETCRGTSLYVLNESVIRQCDLYISKITHSNCCKAVQCLTESYYGETLLGSQIISEVRIQFANSICIINNTFDSTVTC